MSTRAPGPPRTCRPCRRGPEGTIVQPDYAHLFTMTDRVGLLRDAPSMAHHDGHGYRLDDAARGLVVLCRAQPSGPVEQAAWTYLSFVRRCQQPDGRVVEP